MSVTITHTARSDIITSLLRRVATSLARSRERRATMDQLSRMSDRELADIGLSRAGLYGVFAPQTVQAPETSRQVLDDVEEQVLADLGLIRRFPFPAAGD